jgi:recombination protein RecA
LQVATEKANIRRKYFAMPSSSAIRLQIESALAARIPAALTPTARMVRPVVPTGIEALDEALHGGLPVGAITELIGPECSGRTSVALAFVAGLTQAGKVCAWLDVSNALDPASAAAAGVDLRRLLWVRCGVLKTVAVHGRQRFALPEQYPIPKPAIKGLHGGGCGGHPRREVKGMAQAVSGLLQTETQWQLNIAPQCAEPQRRDGSSLGVSTRETAGAKAPNLFRGIIGPAKAVPLLQDSIPVAFSPSDKVVPLQNVPEWSFSFVFEAAPLQNRGYQGSIKPGLREQPGKPWARLDQALRAADLLLQGGGFSAIVLDLGSLAPEFASRVPLATWFRYRAAAESTQASLLLLAQYGCAKSSAELTLRLEPGDALRDEATVFTGMAHSVEVARRRFTGAQDNVVPLRKPVQRANVASWQSHAAWAGVR